jgi:hypothetical protein
MICGNDEVAAHRDLAMEVLDRLEQMFREDLGIAMSLMTWDFRREHPDVVDEDEFAALSLAHVEKADSLIAFLGPSIGDVTRQEVRRGLELQRERSSYQVWVFVERSVIGRDHSAFVDELAGDLHKRIVYGQHETPLELQALLFTTLFPFITRRLFPVSQPLIRSER